MLVFLFVLNFALGDEFLIQELKKLREGLTADDPRRLTITLRLADIYFDESILENKGQQDTQKREQMRKEALSLYLKSLEQHKDSLNPEHKIKIEFQIARILNRLGEDTKANEHFINVYQSSHADKQLKAQSALALAESYEAQFLFDKSLKYYNISQSLVTNYETSSYISYRLSWLFYKENQLQKAIGHMEQALYTKEGILKENNLNDYIMFLSYQDDAKTTLAAVTKIDKSLSMLERMMNAYYASGQRENGTFFLSLINNQKPTLYNEVRLFEQLYDQQKWQDFEKVVTALKVRSDSDLPSDKEVKEEIYETLKRSIVVLDAYAENATPVHLLAGIEIFLNIFPRSPLREKMQQGWLKAQGDEKKKVDMLSQWISENIQLKLDTLKLRSKRLALAQKLKLNNIIIEETSALYALSEKREYLYLRAYTYYQLANFDKALEDFNFIITQSSDNNIVDKFLTLSQNLVLDIYNKKSDYQSVYLLTQKWINDETLSQKDKSVESSDFHSLSKQAHFEFAVSLGATKEALSIFKEYCFKGIYPKKSCDNAKSVSIQLSDYSSLIAIYEFLVEEDKLLVEYERAGHFDKLAPLYERVVLNKKPSIDHYLKAMLFYELALDEKKHTDVTKRLYRHVLRHGFDQKYESLLFNLFDRYALLDSRALKMKWSSSKKLELAQRLMFESNDSKAKKMIAKEKISTGPGWSKLVLEKLEKNFLQLSRYKFYGSGSDWKFKRRVNKLNQFKQLCNSYLDGADLVTRIYIIDMLKRSYHTLAQEIVSTPLPKELDQDSINQIQTQLLSMANPFQLASDEYSKLQASQLVQLGRPLNLDTITSYSALIKYEREVKEKISFDAAEFKKKLINLQNDPLNKNNLVQLKSFFNSSRRVLLAQYFQGRIESLGESL